MCGIFGMTCLQEDFSTKHALLLQALCIADEVRGKHSTGLLGFDVQDQQCYLEKRAMSGTEYVAQGYTEYLFNQKFGAVMGHNRYATQGEKTARNAHPFGVSLNNGWQFGTHNGKVLNYKNLCETFDVKTPDVDSEAVFRCIAKLQKDGFSVEEAIFKVTEDISGDSAFAFAFLSPGDNAIYLWKNSERPCYIFDARKHGLGRWYCSKKEIMATAWGSLRGLLGDISKVSAFPQQNGRLYKMPCTGDLKIQVIGDITLRPKPLFMPTRSTSYSGYSGKRSYLDHYDDMWRARMASNKGDRSKAANEDDDRSQGGLFDDDLQHLA